MQYVLGNMLNGGGGLNPDGLALDLQFAADKTLTARKGPTPVFTRASSGTYFGPLVQFGDQTYPTVGIVNGRAEWKIVDGSNYRSFYYSGARWRHEDFYFGEGFTYEAAEGNEWRPEQADWSGSGLASTPTTSSTFGIVRAATNEPRFDHTSAGVCRGLLIEESRTNICLQSENFGTTWTNDTGNVAISLDQTTSPSGAMGADKISENTTTSNRRIAIQAQAFVSGTTYTFSCFVKAAERDFVQLRFGSAFGGQFQNFVIGGVNAGTIGSGVGATAAIQAYPNGWYRCSITATSATTGSSQVTIGPQISSTALAWNPYVGTIGSGIFVWGAQNEVGSFATSYIPTVASSVVRSADVCSITGANFTGFYNQSEGTLFADVFGFMTDLLGGNRGFAVIADGTYNNSIGIFKAANAALIRAEGTTGNMPQFALNNVYAQFTQYKVALGVKTNDTNAAFNGSLKTTDTSVTLPSTMNRLEFRDPTGAAGGQPSCHLAAIRYYRKRLPNAKLVTLTV